MSNAKMSEESPLFSFNRKEFHTRNSLIRVLDRCVFEANMPVSAYSWHSFRRGAAVFAFELGIADSAVQLLGDWSSSAFQTYLEFSFGRKMSVAKKMARKFDLYVKNLS